MLAIDVFLLDLHNKARANPEAAMEAVGLDLNEGLDPETISPISKPPLKFNTDLKDMCVLHSQDMIDNDFFNHDSPSTGKGTLERFNDSPYTYTAYGENLGIVPTSSVEDDYEMAQLMFDALLVDAGVVGRGHRRSIFTAGYREVGFSQLIGDWQGNTLTHVLTCCFGLSTTAVNSIMGVLLEDVDADGTYDPSEGIGGVTVDIELDGSPHSSTVTDANGYYEADLDPGTYEVIARTTDHDTSETVEVTTVNENVDLFWDLNVTERPSGTFTSSATNLRLNSSDPTVISLTPVNVDDLGDTSYVLAWSILNANVVRLDGLVVSHSGTKLVQATNTFTHELHCVGPGGTLTLSVVISISVFPSFNTGALPDSETGSSGTSINSGSEPGVGGISPIDGSSMPATASGLHPIYGPSPEQSVHIKKPNELFVRIAQVVRVSALSRELDLSFIDGEMPNSEVIRAEVLFGCYNQDQVINTPTPSASVVGKGDRVAVIIDQGVYYVVSKLDRFEYPNNNRGAVYPKNLLYLSLSNLCIGASFEDDAFSYADFIDPETLIVTRVQCFTPNTETDRMARRLLRRMAFTHLQNTNIINVDDPSYSYENGGGGVLPTQPQLINGTVRHKETINNIPYLVDIPFGQADYSGDLSIYSPVIGSPDKASSHPLVAETIQNYYRGSTVLWFDDPDPEWVLVIATYPSWDLTKYIKFIEVPVYGWSERARNDDEDEEIILADSDRVNYLRQPDLVREIDSITRSWIDWGVVDNDYLFSESYHRALSVPATPIGPNTWTFAIHDGYGYSNGSVIFQAANEQKLILGSVTRGIREDGLASNGSPYTYTIAYDDPNAATSTVSLWYSVDLRYFNDGAGDIWESQVTTVEGDKKVWIVYTNGVDQMFKKVHIDYWTDGQYDLYPWQSSAQWSGDVSGITEINNSFREYIYWNSTSSLVFEYKFDFRYNVTGDPTTWYVTQSIPAFHYINIEQGLFVLEVIEIEIGNSFGYGYALSLGSRNRRFIVWYQGVEYVLFNVEIPYNIGVDNWPAIYNFWPWQLDANTTPFPESTPYDVDEEFSSIFYLSPYVNYFVEPIEPYVYRACSYPTMQGDVSSALAVSAVNYSEEDLKADYIQIFIDPKTNSWAVTIKNTIEIKDDRVLTFPDGGGSTSEWAHGVNTLFKIGDQAPTFTKPSVDEIIEL